MVLVDSMQVYSGIEGITNQARRRPAQLVSVVPVTDRWTVACHAEMARTLIRESGNGAVLDAGTGMYLNAILLDVPIAPEVPRQVRHRAEVAAAGETNPRRAARALELEMAGAQQRGSIWSGDLRYETTVVYLRPDRGVLDASIAERSRRILAVGVDEAKRIRRMQREGYSVNPSVLEAVGVRELLDFVDGEITAGQAEERISARTRRLARRQMRWFDKLARTVEGRARVAVLENPGQANILNTMHDTISG